MHRLRQGASPSGADRADDLGGVRGGAAEARSLCRRFDGFHAVPASVSKTCLVRFDNNKYSVTASAVGRPVEVHAYADRIVIRQDGRIVAEHPRSFGRGDTVYDPWHYVPVLARKPGALRNGAPFKDWVLPASMERVRRKLAGADDGNRQMVDILSAVLTDGLPAVEAACAEAIAQGVHSADVVLNILARQRDPGPPATILTPAALTLRHAPIADCARYDNLRRTTDGTNSTLRPHGRAQALRHEGRLRRDHGYRRQTPTRTAAHRRRSAQGRDQRETGALDQVPAHNRQATARQGPR